MTGILVERTTPEAQAFRAPRAGHDSTGNTKIQLRWLRGNASRERRTLICAWTLPLDRSTTVRRATHTSTTGKGKRQ